MVNRVIASEIAYVAFVSRVLCDTEITDASFVTCVPYIAEVTCLTDGTEVTYESHLRSGSGLATTGGTPHLLNENSIPSIDGDPLGSSGVHTLSPTLLGSDETRFRGGEALPPRNASPRRCGSVLRGTSQVCSGALVAGIHKSPTRWSRGFVGARRLSAPCRFSGACAPGAISGRGTRMRYSDGVLIRPNTLRIAPGNLPPKAEHSDPCSEGFLPH